MRAKREKPSSMKAPLKASRAAGARIPIQSASPASTAAVSQVSMGVSLSLPV